MLPNGPAGWGQVRRCSLAYLPAAGTTVRGRARAGGRFASRNLARRDLRGSIDTLAEVPPLERAVRASPHHGPNGAWRARWWLGKASCAMSRTAAGGGPPYRSSTQGPLLAVCRCGSPPPQSGPRPTGRHAASRRTRPTRGKVQAQADWCAASPRNGLARPRGPACQRPRAFCSCFLVMEERPSMLRFLASS